MMMHSFKSAQMRYNKRKVAWKAKQDAKRKVLGDNLSDSKSKKRKLENKIDILDKDADKLAHQAENKENLTPLAKSIAFRTKAKEMWNDLIKANKIVDLLEKEIKLLWTGLCN